MQTIQRNFQAMLEKKWDEGKFVCVGIDPDEAKLPPCVMSSAKQYDGVGINIVRLAILSFTRQIVEKTRHIVGAYKPNYAFFEALGYKGVKLFEEVVELIHLFAPDVPVIGDLKRADIDNTNRGSAKAAFKEYGLDTLTVNPYFGGSSLSPFINYEDPAEGIAKGDKGVIVLCRTSNPGALEFQDRQILISPEELSAEFDLIKAVRAITGREVKFIWPKTFFQSHDYWVMPLYQWVAIRFAARWNVNNNVALVVGATAP